ncbi:MAG: hypothetical protein JJ897_14905 [Marinibacterium sp.]|nr:hypothetical protein [Marinibacterium sp.]
MDFTRDGTISVEVESLGRDDLVEIRVADTGLGIEPKYLDTIFEEFVTIDTGFARETSGTGLGLAITKRLVQAMGGDISADSIPGEGSFFYHTFAASGIDTRRIVGGTICHHSRACISFRVERLGRG